MDPDKALSKTREALDELRLMHEQDALRDPEAALEDLVWSATEHFEALDFWLKQGGFLPREWTEKRT